MWAARRQTAYVQQYDVVNGLRSPWDFEDKLHCPCSCIVLKMGSIAPKMGCLALKMGCIALKTGSSDGLCSP